MSIAAKGPTTEIDAATIQYSTPYKHYVTALLLVVYTFNQTDRSLFGFLMEPIKRELQLSDTKVGFLAGPALFLLYTLIGIPIARLADRSNRVNIISTAIALWSCAVLALATVKTFWHLALSQVGIGIGEAGFAAVAMSVIADYYASGAERVRALSQFNLAIPLSAGLCGLMAGWISQAYGWRAVFVAAALPGLLLALLMKCTIQEPPRRGISSAASPARPPLRLVFKALWRNRSLRHVVIGAALANVAASVSSWFPAFLIRAHGMTTGELGIWYAVICGAGGVVGIWLSGQLTSRYGSRDQRMTVRLMAIATALISPTLVIALWCSSRYLALLMMIVTQALMLFFLTPALSIVQGHAAPTMRATMVSVLILIEVLAAAVIGVQLVGSLSDALAAALGNSASALGWSMTAVSLLAMWSAAHFWLSGRTIGSVGLEA